MSEPFPFVPDARIQDDLLQRGWSERRDVLDPRGYIATPAMTAAANAALLLGKALLLTGEPGCGKTEFAYKIAWDLGLRQPLRSEIKSTTESRDLLYRFDYLARLRDAQAGASRRRPSAYLEFGPLGLAILAAHSTDSEVSWIPEKEWQRAQQLVGVGKRAVVLIDEIDKAPRDVPNDLLTEVEDLYFQVPEIQYSPIIRADRRGAPILVFTSNLEKQLPEPFLRRCVYYHIEFPDATLLQQIVIRRLSFYSGADALLQDALGLFTLLRQRLGRPPGLAELLDFLQVVAADKIPRNEGLKDKRGSIEKAIRALVKNANDQKLVPAVLDQWRRVDNRAE